MERSNYILKGKITLLLALVVVPVFFFAARTVFAEGFCVRGRERCEKYFPSAFYPRQEPTSGYATENKENNASYTWPKTAGGDSERFCLGRICAPFSPTIKEPVITTGTKENTRANGRKYYTTYADVDVDVRGHEQIASYEWGTYRYKPTNYIPADWFYDTNSRYKGINWYWNLVYYPSSFEYTRDYPCGFSRSYMSENKKILGQQAVYKQGTRSVQTLSVTDAKAPARYNFHTDYLALATVGDYQQKKLCVLRLKKADGTTFDKWIFLEGKAPQPVVKSFTINGSPIGDVVDYCRESSRLDWDTEQTSSVTLTGPRIDSDRQGTVNYDVGSDTPQGTLIGLRPKKDGVYTITGESYSSQSPKVSVPVYIYRTRCYENCMIGKVEGALPLARVARAKETNPNLCVPVPFVGNVCAPSSDRLLCDSAFAIAKLQAKVNPVMSFQPPLINAACLAIFVEKELKKEGSNLCKDTLPDEAFDLTELFKNVQSGFIKGISHGFIWGFFSGVVSGSTAGLSGLTSCTGEINQFADAFISFLASEAVSQIQAALGAQFFEGANPNLIGEGIGYHLGDIIGQEIGAEGGSELGVWTASFFLKSRTEACHSSVEKLKEKPKQAEDPVPPPEVSTGKVLQVDAGVTAGSVTNLTPDGAKQINFSQTELQVIESKNATNVSIVGKVDPTKGNFRPEDVGKDLVKANGEFSNLSVEDKHAFGIILFKNFNAVRNNFSTALDALKNEFTYLATQKGWKHDAIDLIVSSPKFANIANCWENTNNNCVK